METTENNNVVDMNDFLAQKSDESLKEQIPELTAENSFDSENLDESQKAKFKSMIQEMTNIALLRGMCRNNQEISELQRKVEELSNRKCSCACCENENVPA